MDIDSRVLSDWMLQGKGKGATDLIVVQDVITQQYFPVYVMPGETVFQKQRAYNQGSHICITDFRL